MLIKRNRYGKDQNDYKHGYILDFTDILEISEDNFTKNIDKIKII